MSNLWDTLPVGLLNDVAIAALGGEGSVIVNGFNAANVKQACYEFEVGEFIIDPCLPEESRKIPLEEGQTYRLRPRSTIVAIVKEELEVPNDCVVRFLLKGKFFTIGIAPVNTYADPGFSGNMGIVLTNVSNRYLKIRRGERIAKAEFEKMPAPVARPYSAQHGFETGHWPILSEYIATPEEIAAAGVDPTSIAQIRAIHGDEIASIAKRLHYYEKVVWIQITITLIAFTALIYFFKDASSPWLALFLGMVSNLLTTIAINSLPVHVKRRLGLD